MIELVLISIIVFQYLQYYHGNRNISCIKQVSLSPVLPIYLAPADFSISQVKNADIKT